MERKVTLLRDVIRDSTSWAQRWQNDDGGFPTDDEGSESCAWTTAGLLWALAASGSSFRQGYMQQALHWLIANQNSDRGIPIVRRGGPSITDATAQAVGAATIAAVQTEDSTITEFLDSCVDWLLQARSQNAGWKWDPSSDELDFTASTSFAVIALAEAKEHLDDKRQSNVDSCLDSVRDWLIAARNQDYGWGAARGMPSRPAHTALVLWAIRESSMALPDIPEAVELLRAFQGPDGGWLYSIDRPSSHSINRIATAYALVALSKWEADLDDVTLRRGLVALIRSYDPSCGCFTLTGSDIKSWPTRDGLIALTHMSLSMNTEAAIRLIDRETVLENEIMQLKEDLSKKDRDFDSRVEESISKEKREVHNKANTLLRMLKFSLVAASFVALAAIDGLIALNFGVDLRVSTAVAAAVWGAIVNAVLRIELK